MKEIGNKYKGISNTYIELLNILPTCNLTLHVEIPNVDQVIRHPSSRLTCGDANTCTQSKIGHQRDKHNAMGENCKKRDLNPRPPRTRINRDLNPKLTRIQKNL